MNTKFINARILPMDGTNLFTGELTVENDRITYVGAERADDGTQYDRVIDCGGNLLLPSFKNAHTHSAMTFVRSYADDLPLHEWLYNRIFPLEAKLNGDDIYALMRLAILEYLTSGITAIGDMYFFRDAMADAICDTGFRGIILDATNNFGGGAEKTAAEMERIRARKNPLLRQVIGVHAEYTTSEALLKEMAALANELRQPVFVHMNETEREVQECVERCGMRPFERMDELGMFNYGGNAYHCVWLSEREFDIIKQRGIYPVTCPASNLKLASGIAPVKRMLEEGLPVAIGTDGPASNNCLDMFREMFLVTALQKVLHGADAVDANEVLKMACVNGAHALGFDDCDALAVGKQADIILLDLNNPNMRPLHNIEKNVVYAGSKSNVLMTMVAGRILYERGQFFVGDSPERIIAEAEKASRRIENA